MINVENRGRHKKELALRNRKMVYQFFKKNPEALQRECQVHTGLSSDAVYRHVKAIRAGWKPGDRS